MRSTLGTLTVSALLTPPAVLFMNSLPCPATSWVRNCLSAGFRRGSPYLRKHQTMSTLTELLSHLASSPGSRVSGGLSSWMNTGAKGLLDTAVCLYMS